MRNIKLTLCYDGTNYVGWQVQPNGSSVQGLVQEAIDSLVNSRVDVIASGRTDAGVHAIAQVANVKIESTISLDGIIKGANSILPNDIAVIDAEEMAESFHAMRDANGKQYRYRILCSRYRIPFYENRAWRIREDLDVEQMQAASRHLIGEHDFESFRASGCTAPDAIRTVTSITFEEAADDLLEPLRGKGRLIDIIFEGNGFVRHMIRNLVGTLVEVGHGNIFEDDVRSILKKKNRQEAHRCAPACGLYLVKVFYSV